MEKQQDRTQLSYEVQEIVYKKVFQKTVAIPLDWGMTKSANKQMNNRATKLIDKCLKIKTSNVIKVSDISKILEKFVYSYKKSCLNNKNFIGGQETLVRENVFIFIRDIGRSFDLSNNTIRDIWNNTKK